MKLAVLLKGDSVSNPADSEACLVIDVSSCCRPIKTMKLADGASGVAKISQIAMKLIPMGVAGVVTSRVGVEGFKALRDLGLKIYRFEGSLNDLERHIRARGLDLEEIDDQSKIDFNCPCCSRR